jgi:hypothetical protein
MPTVQLTSAEWEDITTLLKDNMKNSWLYGALLVEINWQLNKQEN